MTIPTCNECGNQAFYKMDGWDDETYGLTSDSFWCEKHNKPGSKSIAHSLTSETECEECNRLNELGVCDKCPSCTKEASSTKIELQLQKQHLRLEKISSIIWIIIGVLLVGYATFIFFQ